MCLLKIHVQKVVSAHNQLGILYDLDTNRLLHLPSKRTTSNIIGAMSRNGQRASNPSRRVCVSRRVNNAFRSITKGVSNLSDECLTTIGILSHLDVNVTSVFVAFLSHFAHVYCAVGTYDTSLAWGEKEDFFFIPVLEIPSGTG